MLMFVLAAHAADPTALAPFRIGAAERGNLEIEQEDWTAELSAALTEAGSPVDNGAAARLSAVVRTSACLRVWEGALSLKRCLPTDMDQALHATVVIASGNSTGSGVLVSPDGWVLTAAHVIGTTGTPTVRTRGGVTAPATVVRIDRDHALALPARAVAPRSEPLTGTAA
ncbi:MAG: serine protease [Myxococcota bacterium]